MARAVEKRETQGFIKIVVDADTHQILGAAILGVSGDEVIHGKVPYTTLQPRAYTSDGFGARSHRTLWAQAGALIAGTARQPEPNQFERCLFF